MRYEIGIICTVYEVRERDDYYLLTVSDAYGKYTQCKVEAESESIARSKVIGTNILDW